MASPVRTASSRGESSLPPVQIMYYRRMKLQRVYPVVVQWGKGAAPAAGQKIKLRLLMAGAQIVPAEQTLDAGKLDQAATFFVTPLARGWLRAQRLQIIHEGRKAQDVAMVSKAVTHRLTWCLLLLAVIAPFLMHNWIKNSSFLETSTFDVRGIKAIKANRSEDDVRRAVHFAIADNVPEMPEVIDEYLPSLNENLKDARRWVAHEYGHLVFVSADQPIAFYTALCFLGLALFSAVTHRDLRRRVISQPIQLVSSQ